VEKEKKNPLLKKINEVYLEFSVAFTRISCGTFHFFVFVLHHRKKKWFNSKINRVWIKKKLLERLRKWLETDNESLNF
jgi:hypothetical protein